MRIIHRKPHKWSLATLMLLASGLVVVGICVYLAVRGPGESPAPTSGQVVRHDDLTSSFAINYPVLHLEKIDRTLRAFAEKQTDKFVAKIRDKQFDPGNKLTLKFKVSHYGDQTLSVIFNITENMVGKSEVTSRHILTFDVKSEEQLTVSDLFREDSDGQKVLANIFYDYFRQSDKAGLTPQQQLRLLDFTAEDVRDFLLFEDTIVLYINPKDLANKKKAQAVSVNKSVVASVLKDAYRVTDTGRKLDVPVKVAYTITTVPTRAAPNAGGGRRIALTFDDGPGAHTSRLLDTLAKYRSRATFYVLGHSVHGHADIIQRMINEGSEVGNHTWNHPNLTLLSAGQIDQQIGDTQRAIQQVTGGYTPRTVRPPYGATNGAVGVQVGSYGLAEVLWSVDVNDWQTRDSQLIYDRIMGGAADGRVILLHDIYGSSVDGAIWAIPDLLAQGYQLVTVSELYGY